MFVSYVTSHTLLFICWMFAWIRDAHEQSQMPRRVLHSTHRESEAEENVLQKQMRRMTKCSNVDRVREQDRE